jgi:protein-tyrosine-phosphatase
MRFLLNRLIGRLRAYRALATARRTTHANLRTPVTRILVVCYGNIYRSAFLGAYLTKHAPVGVEIRSGGFHKKTGRPAPDRHVDMSRQVGVDLTAHRSSSIAIDDVRWADIIVAMDRHNWHALCQLGAPSEKIVWAGALTSGSVEINDPYEMDDAAAHRTIERLLEAGDALLKQLQAQSKG